MFQKDFGIDFCLKLGETLIEATPNPFVPRYASSNNQIGKI